jgi:hypothetical protein
MEIVMIMARDTLRPCSRSPMRPQALLYPHTDAACNLF